jgi:hypothetical protein
MGTSAGCIANVHYQYIRCRRLSIPRPDQIDDRHALDSHIIGFTRWQVSMPFEAKDLPAMGGRFLRELPIEEFPFVAEHVRQHIAGVGNSGGTEFAFGLDLILDGLERTLAASSEGRRPRRAAR